MEDGQGNNGDDTSPKKSIRGGTKLAKEGHLDFLYDLHIEGVPLPQNEMEALRKNGYFREDRRINKKEDVLEPQQEKEVPLREDKLLKKTDDQKHFDTFIDIIEEKDDDEEDTDGTDNTKTSVISDTQLEKRRQEHGYIFEGRKKNITNKDWLPQPLEGEVYEKPFVEWIDSINAGFNNRGRYRKFTLYVQQAYEWLSDGLSAADFYEEDAKEEYMMEELRRCSINSLYFLNKYIYYKDTVVKSGQTKYIAAPAHEIESYLNDCGYSTGEAKPRQMAMTTTKMALKLASIVFKRNYYMKFITEDEKKAEEIFEDKLKYPFSQLPEWMKPNVLNERENFFKLGDKESKGDRDGVNSTIRVAIPKRTVIAGGSPDEVDIDEAGNIGLLTEMLDNQRPTRLWFNPETKKLEVKRKVNFFGTGGETDRGGKAFEIQMLSLMRQWQQRNFNAYIVPVFFSWHARPGATQADYDREYALAYSDNGPDAEKTKREFHQSWPNSLADVFRTSANTLVDEAFIEANVKRILEAQQKMGHPVITHGYFEPIFDESVPADSNSDLPFKVIGAEFIPTEDLDPRSTTMIFQHPKRGWKNRYFQGTDPIDTIAGTSNFASAIWDKHYQTLSAVVDFRVSNIEYVFQQSMLLGLYYDVMKDVKDGVQELIESNRGTAYTLYKKNKGFLNNMVLNSEMEVRLMTANNTSQNEGIGIDNKGNRNITIISYMREMNNYCAQNFYIPKYFEQLRTFVCHVTDGGRDTWGPMNKKYFKDDILFGAVFSYICAEIVYKDLRPIDTQNEVKRRVVTEHRLIYDSNMNQRRITIKKRV